MLENATTYQTRSDISEENDDILNVCACEKVKKKERKRESIIIVIRLTMIIHCTMSCMCTTSVYMYACTCRLFCEARQVGVAPVTCCCCCTESVEVVSESHGCWIEVLHDCNGKEQSIKKYADNNTNTHRVYTCVQFYKGQYPQI